MTNTGHVAGYAVAQIYLGLDGRGEAPTRLVGFTKLFLQPGQTRSTTVAADPRLLAEFDGASDSWKIAGGTYRVFLNASSADVRQVATTTLQSRTLAP